MNIDAALTGLSLVSFLALLVTWLAAPLRADAPDFQPAIEAAPSSSPVAA
jgi:hypothetical protein